MKLPLITLRTNFLFRRCSHRTQHGQTDVEVLKIIFFSPDEMIRGKKHTRAVLSLMRSSVIIIIFRTLCALYQ